MDFSDEHLKLQLQKNPIRLLDFSVLGDVSKLEFIRDYANGQPTTIQEVLLKPSDEYHYDLTSKSSVSLKRCTSSGAEKILGNVTNLPFKPPALDLTDKLEQISAVEAELKKVSFKEYLDDQVSNLETLIPGTNLKPNFDPSSSAQIKSLMKLDEDDNNSLDGYIQKKANMISKKLRISSRNVSESATSKIKKNDESHDLCPQNIKKEKIIEKEMIKSFNRVLNISIKDCDLLVNKSSEFAKCIDIGKEPEEKLANPAKTYEFELDTFQKQAIIHMEKFCNVFVAAHTSAGKTVVAEYAIAMARRSMTKVVYTSPIKALSNQKYRDFSMEFGDVGLITGDVQVNPDASCLILTTEILLQMLDYGSDIIRDLEWAIFDEVHYVNDEERGHVWERVFIMLPEHVNLVLLSATVPNVVQFAEWLGRIRKKPTVVITTAKRPVPLEHYLYTGSDSKTISQRYKFIDSSSQFKEFGYKQALQAKKQNMQNLKGPKGQIARVTPADEKRIYINLIRHLQKCNLLPVICFTFSRKRCDSNAWMLHSLDLTTGEEKSKIHKFVTRALNRFKEADRKLRQVMLTKEMLKRGFGVHHSGVLPLLKEITEILFCEGLVKVLFATETFAMGVNMPAKSVVFDSIQKLGRYLYPAEYIQMAGRAGRRGKDSVGTVIVVCKKEVPEASDLIAVALGEPMPLESKFQLKYSMILTLLRARHHLKIESVIGKSFIEHERQSTTLENQARQQTLIKQVSLFKQPNCDICINGKMNDFCDYFLSFMTRSDAIDVRREIFSRALAKGKIIFGRTLVLIGTETNPASLGVVVRVQADASPQLVEILHLKDYSSGKVEYSSMKFDGVLLILKETIHANWNDIYQERELLNKGKIISKVCQKLRDVIQKLESPKELLCYPHLQPYQDLGLNELNFVDMCDQYKLGYDKLKGFECWNCPQFIQHFQAWFKKHQNMYEFNHISYLLSPDSLFFMPEYKMKLEVLRKLNYINEENVPELKAKVACLMSVHELVVTEMLTENMLADCSPPEIAALLTVFVYQQKKHDDVLDEKLDISDKLHSKLNQLVAISERIGKVQVECGLTQPVEDFVQLLNFGLVGPILVWAQGSSFAEVLKITDEQEGIIVRCIQRLDEVLKTVKAACKLIGHSDICEKIEEAHQAITRDIVFAASLYIFATQEGEGDADDGDELYQLEGDKSDREEILDDGQVDDNVID